METPADESQPPPRADSARGVWRRHDSFTPLALYTLAFVALTFPRITQFSSHFYADTGDGLQNVWNLWWIQHAIVTLHQSPWATTYVHYPFGSSLHTHTLNAFNGLATLPLAPFLSLVQRHNLVVVFSFVAGGYTAFLLARYTKASYSGSVLAGFIFSFSQYHFAHAEGHLQLVSLEWLPLGLLLYLRWLDTPTARRAMAAGLIAFAVYLCDYYYFFYLILSWALTTIWAMSSRRDVSFLLRAPHRRGVLVLAGTIAVTVGPLFLQLAGAAAQHALLGSHDAERYSMDLLAPFIPGGHWRFGELTRRYWSQLPVSPSETSVYIGYSVWALVAIAVARLRRIDTGALWLVLLIVCFLLALGPRLQVGGQTVSSLPLPYQWLVSAAPFLEIGGVPIRIIVMVTLAAAILAAHGFAALSMGGGAGAAARAFVMLVLVVEYLPSTIPASHPDVFTYVTTLANSRGNEAFLDATGRPPQGGLELYYQTIHHKPIGFGYTSRVSEEVASSEFWIGEAIKSNDFRSLRCDYGFRYVLLRFDAAAPAAATLMTREAAGTLYDLGTASRCMARHTPHHRSRSGEGAVPDLRGYIDHADCHVVLGWAYDGNEPEGTADVEMSEAEAMLGGVPATLFREDLEKAGVGDGRHSFRFVVPASLKDGRAHRVDLKIVGSDFSLPGSPLTLGPCMAPRQ
jgi:hypothetical protein